MLSIVNCQLSTVNYVLSTADCRLPTADNGYRLFLTFSPFTIHHSDHLPVTPVTRHSLPVTNIY